MKKMKRILPLLLAAALLLTGCKKDGDSEQESEKSDPVSVDFAKDESEMFTERDLSATFTEADAVRITLTGESATASSDAVRISGGTVQITKAATYILEGTLTNGQIVVSAAEDAKVQLVLRGADITCAQHAPLLIESADKVFLTLAEGTSNILANGGSFPTDSNVDGTLFSRADLTIGGTGALSITSDAGHGIVCKDDLVITGGTLAVSASGHALDANDSVRVCRASLTLSAGKDGIHVENSEDTSLGYFYMASGTLAATAGGDGVDAAAFVQVTGGTLALTAGGGADATLTDDVSAKGLSATGSMLIESGTLTLNAADDALHANASIVIKGGSFTLASGDDGVHADETLEIHACSMTISQSYEGLEALHVSILGGEITLTASDDGINAAGGTDGSGFGGMGGGGDHFGPGGGMGRPPMGGRAMGMPSSSASDGSITVSGGTLHITAYGDGMDANGTLSITGGHVTVCGPTQGDTATLDYDVSGSITGGTFIGTGASGMAQSFSNAKQGLIAVRVGTQGAGTTVTLTDKDGNVLLEVTPALSFAVVILSCPEMESGESYTLTVGTLCETIEAS